MAKNHICNYQNTNTTHCIVGLCLVKIGTLKVITYIVFEIIKQFGFTLQLRIQMIHNLGLANIVDTDQTAPVGAV